MPIAIVSRCRLLAAVCVIALAACGGKPDTDPASTASKISPEAQAYRDAVLDTAGKADPSGPDLLRKAYAALDAGEQSRQVREAGGIAMVRYTIRNFELLHEVKPLDVCNLGVFDLRDPNVGKTLVKALVAAGRLPALEKDAERADAMNFRAALGGFGPNPTEEQRATVAFQILARRATSRETIDILARLDVHIAALTEGKCVPSPKLLSLLENTP